MLNKVKEFYPDITDYIFNQLYQLVLTDLYMNYSSYSYRQVFENRKSVSYEEFKYKPISIINASCKFHLSATHIIGTDYLNWVEYKYIPNTHTPEDEQIMIYGICAEYCLLRGDFDTAKVWNDKYKELIKNEL